jgi:polygalacturonase
MPMIPRANTQYKCGEDGSLANNCTMLGGSFHVMFNDFVFGEELTGVTIQGFQFVAPQLHSVLAVGSGDVTFLDCVLKVRQWCTMKENSTGP